MSACISSHGEYSSHELDDDQACKWCGVFDEEAFRHVSLAAAEARGRREGQQWAIDALRDGVLTLALRDEIKQAILDEAPVWTEDFDAGPGQVCGVPDAAVVATRAVAAWLDRLTRSLDSEQTGGTDG